MKNHKLLSYLASRLKQIRTDKKISQSDVLVDTGIHIGRIETGSRDISISTLLDICNYYEVSPGELFEGYKK